MVSEINRLFFLKSKLLKLDFSDLSLDNFSFHFLTIGTMTEVFNIWWLKRTSGVLHQLFLYHMHTSEGRFVMLSLYHCRLVFLVHAFDGFPWVALEVLVARFDGVFDINDLFFPKVFEIHVFGATDFLLILVDFNFHFVDETHSNRVK